MTAISQALGVDGDSVRGGGSRWDLVPYVSTKDPRVPHATMDAAAIATATTLSCYHALASGEPDVAIDGFDTTGTLIIDVLAVDAAEEEKAFSALATSDFTITALTTGRSAGCIVKLKDADDYADTDWKCIGSTQGGTLRGNQDATPIYDDFGVKVGSLNGPLDIGVNLILLQSGKAELDFLFKALKTTPLYALRQITQLDSGGHQIIIYPKVKLLLKAEMEFKNQTPRTIPIQIEVMAKDDWEEFEVWEG